MRSGTFQSCPNCQTALDLTGPIYILRNDPLNDIYICNVCGLVYKPSFNVNPQQSISNTYSPGAWNPFLTAHRERLRELASTVASEVSLRPEDAVLDIGAGIGLLHDALREVAPSMGRYFAVEPVYDIAVQLKTARPSIVVLNGEFGDVVVPPRAFKAVFVCGVDYLFRDIRAAFQTINTLLADDGVAVIQRQVFIDQQGYIGAEITDLDGMFSPNAIMRNWFHSQQYVEFIAQFFAVRRTWKTVETFPRQGGGEFTCFSINMICERRDTAAGGVERATRSYWDVNVRHLNDLRRRTPARDARQLAS